MVYTPQQAGAFVASELRSVARVANMELDQMEVDGDQFVIYINTSIRDAAANGRTSIYITSSEVMERHAWESADEIYRLFSDMGYYIEVDGHDAEISWTCYVGNWWDI